MEMAMDSLRASRSGTSTRLAKQVSGSPIYFGVIACLILFSLTLITLVSILMQHDIFAKALLSSKRGRTSTSATIVVPSQSRNLEIPRGNVERPTTSSDEEE
jgi:hypothetical protein